MCGFESRFPLYIDCVVFLVYSSNMKVRSWRVSEYRRRIKERAVAYKGGKCQRCGYNKCLAAFDFHHRDPEAKDLSLGSRVLRWETIRRELDKCDLLCATCHREVHDELEEKKRATYRKTFAVKKCPPIVEPCAHCGTDVKVYASRKDKSKSSHVFCGVPCRSAFQEVGAWPSDEELADWVSRWSLSSVGRRIGVSHNSIRHRCKQRGIPIPGRSPRRSPMPSA